MLNVELFWNAFDPLAKELEELEELEEAFKTKTYYGQLGL